MSRTDPGHPRAAGLGRLLAVPLLVAASMALLVVAFAWPTARSAPRDVPVVVAGPPAAAEQVVQRLEAAAPGAWQLEVVPTEQAARTALAEREAYGALVLGGPGQPPVLLTATAASPTVAQLLTGVATALGQQASAVAPPAVVDLAPPGEGDPRGAGLAAAALPLTLGGMLTGLLSVTLLSGVRARLTAVVLCAATGALTVTALLYGWLGVLPADATTVRWWATAGLLGLLVTAVATTLVGLHGLAGRAGLGLGAGTMFALGNPLSAAASAPELLPTGWGGFGQLLPPGAGLRGLRGTAFFDGAGTAQPVLVLSCWLAAGLLLLGVAAVRDRNRSTVHGEHPAAVERDRRSVPAPVAVSG